MRFEWEDEVRETEGEIYRYECTLYDDDEKKLDAISFWDYSSKLMTATDEKNKCFRPYAYEVDHYHGGSSFHKGFDYDENYREHHGWHGVKEHTVEDMKRWCEAYVAKLYIFDYEKELAELNRLKEMSDWFVANGYGTPEEEIER